MGLTNSLEFHLAGEPAGNNEAAGNRGLVLVGDMLTEFPLFQRENWVGGRSVALAGWLARPF